MRAGGLPQLSLCDQAGDLLEGNATQVFAVSKRVRGTRQATSVAYAHYFLSSKPESGILRYETPFASLGGRWPASILT